MAMKIRKCERCHSPMARNGKQWLNQHKCVQRWRCTNKACHHTTIKKAGKE